MAFCFLELNNAPQCRTIESSCHFDWWYGFYKIFLSHADPRSFNNEKHCLNAESILCQAYPIVLLADFIFDKSNTTPHYANLSFGMAFCFIDLKNAPQCRSIDSSCHFDWCFGLYKIFLSHADNGLFRIETPCFHAKSSLGQAYPIVLLTVYFFEKINPDEYHANLSFRIAFSFLDLSNAPQCRSMYSSCHFDWYFGFYKIFLSHADPRSFNNEKPCLKAESILCQAYPIVLLAGFIFDKSNATRNQAHLSFGMAYCFFDLQNALQCRSIDSSCHFDWWFGFYKIFLGHADPRLFNNEKHCLNAESILCQAYPIVLLADFIFDKSNATRHKANLSFGMAFCFLDLKYASQCPTIESSCHFDWWFGLYKIFLSHADLRTFNNEKPCLNAESILCQAYPIVLLAEFIFDKSNATRNQANFSFGIACCFLDL